MRRVNPQTVIFALLILLGGLGLTLGVIRSATRRVEPHAIPVGATSRLGSLPHIILWAWERPEQLDFLDTNKVGVAFLARTIHLRSDRVVVRPRLQPLSLPPNTTLIAVARIESDRREHPSLSPNQIEAAAREIAALAQLPNVIAVQVDFDAVVSERDFYSELLKSVRRTLPPRIGLSITALASWCKGDNWLDQLPIDEAVPMLFRMGIDRSQIVNSLAAGETFQGSFCGQSSGVSTDEALPYLPPKARVYVFHPRSWSPDSVAQALEKFDK